LIGPPAVCLRPAADSDHPFLRTLFASARESELAFLPGAAAQRELFCDLQFNAQSRSYRESFPGASHDIVEVDGSAAGRLYVDRSGNNLHLIDISLLTEYRGRGIGTKLLTDLLEEASRTGVIMSLYVAESNRARHLYERLGFRTVRSDGVYLFQMTGEQ
jgi:ribosomal protein S18 acetylase RimI-like enzyme